MKFIEVSIESAEGLSILIEGHFQSSISKEGLTCKVKYITILFSIHLNKALYQWLMEKKYIIHRLYILILQASHLMAFLVSIPQSEA